MKVFIAALTLALLPQESLEQRRDRIASKIEDLRGLKYAKPLPIREGTRKQYAQVGLDQAKSLYGDDLDAAGRCFGALGLVPSSMKLSLAITASASTEAFYAGGEMVVVDSKIADDNLLFRMLLGLLDQHFPEAELRRAAGGSLDAQMAITALRQGDADVTKHLLWNGGKLPDDWIRKQTETTEKWEREDSRFRSAIIPRLLVRAGDFGFRRGSIFVETVRRKGGADLLNKTHKDPPVSTEQILHPEKFLEGEGAVALDLSLVETCLKGEGYTLAYRTTFGELGTAILLETHLKNEDVSAGSAGWGGDTLLYFEGKGQAIVVWATEWDTENDGLEFQTLLQKISNALMPKDSRINTVLRRKTSVVFIGFAPKIVQELVLDKLWKCKRKGKKEDLYGGD